MSDDPLIRLAEDTAANKTILQELAPLVRQTHETLHVQCTIDTNGHTGLVAIVQDLHKFVSGCRRYIHVARKTAIYTAVTAATTVVIGFVARCLWLLIVWLWGCE